MDTSKVYYIAGPISGIEAFNYPAFKEAAERLRQQGYTVVSPFEINALQHRREITETREERIEYFKNDIRALLDCQGIIMLPGWQDSKGASLEYTLATMIGLDVLFLKHDDLGVIL